MALTDGQITIIVREAAKGSALRRDGSTTNRIARAIESAATAPLLERIAALEAQVEQAAQPVLVVEREPDYWSGGHFHRGEKPHINLTKVWGLPIGTKLYTRDTE